MTKGYHKGQELTISELGLSLEELAGQPLELFARLKAKNTINSNMANSEYLPSLLLGITRSLACFAIGYYLFLI